MRIVYLEEEDRVKEFALKAANHFKEYKNHTSFTGGDIKPGCLFALKWGLGNDCILVFRLNELFEPIIYQQIIKGE